jgi:hypothetical protein
MARRSATALPRAPARGSQPAVHSERLEVGRSLGSQPAGPLDVLKESDWEVAAMSRMRLLAMLWIVTVIVAVLLLPGCNPGTAA